MCETKTKHWPLIAALIALLALAGACGSDSTNGGATQTAPDAVGQRVETDGGSYVNMTPQELQSMLGDDDILLVNAYAGDIGEIEDTDLFIPFDQIARRLGELPSERDSQIVLYCRSGGSSAIAASTLVGLGYTNVWNLEGGIIAWEEAGYALLR